jgi:hypothetical protein
MNAQINIHQRLCSTPRPLPHWPERTIAVLSTQDEQVHAIPVTAPLRSGDRQILLRLRRCRGSLARLRDHPLDTVAIDVDEIDDHRQSWLVVESGVSLHWADERTRLFLQEHRDALRAVAAAQHAQPHNLSFTKSVPSAVSPAGF